MKTFGKVITLLLCLNLCACAVRTKDMAYYTFDYPTPPKEANILTKETIMVYRFLLDRSVPMDSLTVHEPGENKAIRSLKWEDNPADMITDLVLRDLQSAGLFERAVDQLSTSKYRFALEGLIKNLHGLKKEGKTKACLEMEATLTDFEANPDNKNMLKKIYNVEIPCEDETPEALMKSLNQAVKEASRKLRNDIRGTLETTGMLQEKDTGRKNRVGETQIVKEDKKAPGPAWEESAASGKKTGTDKTSLPKQHL